MSRHHRAQQWTSHAPRLRAQITALLPLPCIECGRPVLLEQRWHVGHRRAAAAGGTPTLANCGPAHATCNVRAGGRLGAAVVNARRASSDGIRPW